MKNNIIFEAFSALYHMFSGLFALDNISGNHLGTRNDFIPCITYRLITEKRI